MNADLLKAKIRHVPDFPKPGILFYDITTLLRDAEGLRLALDAMAAPFVDTPIDLVVGMESRGFIFGAALAYQLGAGFVPVRKPGKLPALTQRVTYELEYGSDSLEIHADAITAGQRVLSSTTCSPPAARRVPRSTWSARSAPRSSPVRSSWS